MFEDRLNHKVAKLVIDQDLYAFKGDSNQIFFPLALRRRYAIFNHLAPMLVSGNVRKMLHNWLIND